MTTAQKIALRISEVRQRLNEIAGIEGDAFTDEVRTESENLQREYGVLEIRHRSALISEGAEQADAEGAFGNGDGESAERGRLLREVRVADYFGPAIAGTGLAGAAAELNAALDVPIIGTGGGVALPYAVLEQRAFTTTTQNDGSEIQRPILQRLFGPGILDALGVRLDAVPTGRSEWPLLASGVSPAQAKEGTAAAAAVAAGFTTATLRPKRLTGRYELTHEEIASVADIEQALRRDIADAVKSSMSDQIVNGDTPDNTNPQHVEGFLNAITAPGDASAVATFEDYAGAHAAGVDGIHAERENEVSSIVGVDVYKHAATVYQTGSGESGSEALMRRSMGCRASSYVPLAVSTQTKGNIFHLAGPNGGGVMRGDSIAAMWPTLEIIRDIYSKASQGVVLTWVALWDAKVAFRTAAYQRVAFKVA